MIQSYQFYIFWQFNNKLQFCDHHFIRDFEDWNICKIDKRIKTSGMKGTRFWSYTPFIIMDSLLNYSTQVMLLWFSFFFDLIPFSCLGSNSKFVLNKLLEKEIGFLIPISLTTIFFLFSFPKFTDRPLNHFTRSFHCFFYLFLFLNFWMVLSNFSFLPPSLIIYHFQLFCKKILFPNLCFNSHLNNLNWYKIFRWGSA